MSTHQPDDRLNRRQLGLAAAVFGAGAAAALAGMPAAAQEGDATPAASPAPDGPGWEVPAKRLTVADTVSPELAPLIANPPGELWLTTPTVDQVRQLQAALLAKGESARALWEELGLEVEEAAIAGVPCYRLQPPTLAPENADRLLVHHHGGAYVFNGGPAASIEAAFAAVATGIPVVSIDYRMPPDHPYPAALEDAVAVWQELLKDHDPGRMGMFGTSAGGGLTMAAILRLAELGVRGPAAAYLSTPWADLSKTGDSYVVNAMVDNVIVTWDGLLGLSAELYADGEDLTDPFISPVYGDLSVFPPTLLITGTRDLFLSNTVRTHLRLLEHNIEARLICFDGLSHGQWTPWDDPLRMAEDPVPETRFTGEQVRQFFDRHLAR